MNKLNRVFFALCTATGTVLLLIAALFITNTYVGSETGHFFSTTSTIGTLCRIASLFVPFLYAAAAFCTGIATGSKNQPMLFAISCSILSITNILSPFMIQFVFANGVGNSFTKMLATVATFLSMPAHSMAHAFNDTANILFADFAAGRILVFIATFLCFLLPLLLVSGHLLGTVRYKRNKLKEAMQ